MADATLADLTGQPRTIPVAAGPVAFYPLTIADISEFDAWAREDFLRSVQPAIEAIGDWTARNEARVGALDESRRISFGSPKAYGAMTSIAGKLRLCWLSMRHGPADVKAADGRPIPLSCNEAWIRIASGKVTPQSWKYLNAAYVAVMIVSGFVEEKTEDADPSTLAQKTIGLMVG